MSWLFTILAAVLSAIVGGAGMMAIAMACIKWYRISSFEGGSGYFAIALTILGLLGGFIVGLIAARVGLAKLSPTWYGQLGTGTGTVAFLLLLVLMITYACADHTPELGGRGIVVAWEVRLPAEDPADPFAPKGRPADWPAEELKLQLVSVVRGKSRGSGEATFDRDAFRQDQGQWVLPARVPLFTSKGEFCVNLTLGGRDDGFWPRVTAFPSGSDFEWTPWYRTNKSMGKPSDAQAVMYRFRYEQADAKTP